MTLWHTGETGTKRPTRTVSLNSLYVALCYAGTPGTPQALIEAPKTQGYPDGGIWRRFLRNPPLVIVCFVNLAPVHLLPHTHTK